MAFEPKITRQTPRTHAITSPTHVIVAIDAQCYFEESRHPLTSISSFTPNTYVYSEEWLSNALGGQHQNTHGFPWRVTCVIRFPPSHCRPEQPKIQTEVLGHSLVHSLVHSHRSLVRLLRPAPFACALRCATHSLACSLRSLPRSWESE